MKSTCQNPLPRTAPINLGLPESALVEQVNKRLRKHRMELVSTEDALFGDTVNFGSWFVRKSIKATPSHPRPFMHLVQRRTTPQAVAANLNNGILPK